MRQRALRRLLPSDAGSRRLPAALAVRGLVSVARTHRRPRAAHARGGPRGVRLVSVLGEIAAAAGPSLQAYAVAEPGPQRFDCALGERLFVLEAVYEGYLLHYGDSRLFAGMDADLRLLA